MTRRNRTDIAGWMPFGLGQAKPNHFVEMARVLWENRANLPYAWRILQHGVCDGCALGPRGLYDDAMDGIHLCVVRLKMLRINTMPALDVKLLGDVARLEKLDGRQLRELGRLPYPMLRRKGERGFTRIAWDDAFARLGARMRHAAQRDPNRLAIYTTSRGLTNEVYYVAQKVARVLGTNNVDNAARLCHAASTVALKQTLGVGASTCSYKDWIGTDLIVLLGSDAANNQPVAMKYFYYAKQQGARILVVNPYREPGLERYWIPSVVKSALFGTRLADEFFQVRIGGDIAFLNGVLKWLITRNWLDEKFIAEHTAGFAELKAALEQQPWEELERASGVIRDQMLQFAEIYAQAKNAVFIWSMGLTQHRFGVENVKAVVNVALARGMLGRANAGVVPIRGHSGVQAGAECGSVPAAFPGGVPVNEENARHFGELWGAELSPKPGLSAAEMLDAAEHGQLDVFYIAGGNFVETMPEPERMRGALSAVPCRVHQDLFLNSAMLAEPGEEVLLLPGQTRYEQRGGGTVTSTERRIRYTPEIRGPRIGEALPEWEIFMRAGQAALGPERAHLLHFADAQAIRDEMERCIPLYKGIGALQAEGESVQYGGALLCTGGYCAAMPEGKAKFTPLTPPDVAATFRSAPSAAATETARPKAATFYLATRRGKQFNSMVYAENDPITGTSRRDAVFISPEDAARLSLQEGDALVLHPVNGTGDLRVAPRTSPFRGVAKLAPVKSGTLQAYWPEANVLIESRLDPASKEPDYNAWVTIEKA